jgi:hypothetical protein
MLKILVRDQMGLWIGHSIEHVQSASDSRQCIAIIEFGFYRDLRIELVYRKLCLVLPSAVRTPAFSYILICDDAR